MKLAADWTLRVIGGLLLVAAGLKGWQLLTEPLANSDIWSNRAFLILTVEFELGLGIWLVSGLFKKLAWAAGECANSVLYSRYLENSAADDYACMTQNERIREHIKTIIRLEERLTEAKLTEKNRP